MGKVKVGNDELDVDLTEQEIDQIKKLLGREPNFTE